MPHDNDDGGTWVSSTWGLSCGNTGKVSNELVRHELVRSLKIKQTEF